MDVPSRTDRFDIDPLRGLVCLSLCVLHFYVGPLYGAFDDLFGEDGRNAVHRYRPGVESFFVLAGLLLAHSLRPIPGERVSAGAYLRRRFLRLVIPYWAAVLLATVDRWLPALLGRPEPDAAGWKEVGARLLFIEELFGYPEAAVGYWSMVSLEQFYLLWVGALGLIMLFVPPGDSWRATRIMAVPTLVACVASAIWVCHSYYLGDADPFGARFKLTKVAVYLTFGMLLYWSIRGGFGRWHFVVALVAVGGMAAYTDRAAPYKALLIAAVLVPLVGGWRWPDSWATRALGFVGRRSYSIYLIHPIVGNRFLMVDAIRDGSGLSDWWAFAELIGALAVSVAAGAVFYRLVEWPMYQRAQRVKYRRSEPAVGPRVESVDAPGSWLNHAVSQVRPPGARFAPGG